jgi:hypothetical protein
MVWTRKRILVTVKANPERSKKYGQICCTAGITDGAEWIRIYPIKWETLLRIPRYSWIEAEVEPVAEKLGRKESHRIRESTIRIADDSLTRSPVDWKARNAAVLPLLNQSVEELKESFERDRVSLGLVKPRIVRSFYKTDDLDEMFQRAVEARARQATLAGDSKPILKPYDHIFKYRWQCRDLRCLDHDMTCEDWELFASFNNWKAKYGDMLWQKLYQKYYTELYEQRDLHFYVGTHSQYPVWMIIGLYYPPRQAGTGPSHIE